MKTLLKILLAVIALPVIIVVIWVVLPYQMIRDFVSDPRGWVREILGE